MKLYFETINYRRISFLIHPRIVLFSLAPLVNDLVLTSTIVSPMQSFLFLLLNGSISFVNLLPFLLVEVTFVDIKRVPHYLCAYVHTDGTFYFYVDYSM